MAPLPVLFIANGHGEDSIAAEIIRRLPPGRPAHSYPVVGAGQAFEGLCERVGPRLHVPSEGWRHTSGSVARDTPSMLSGIRPALRFLRACRGRYDKVVVVGDGVGPLLCMLAGLRIDIYLDVFKSGYAHAYSPAERFVLRRAVATVFCRDDMLAHALRDRGIDARCAGNVMLDCVPRGAYDMAARRRALRALVLLPGSRATTAENLAVQVEALRRLPPGQVPDVFVAVAAGIDAAELARATNTRFIAPDGGEAADLGRLRGERIELHLATGVLGTLVEGADLVLSQAGTATQQALGLGRPVITFDRADNRRKRMRDEQALMGEARLLLPPETDVLAAAIARLLADPQEARRLGAIGRERLGGPGTISAVLELLVSSRTSPDLAAGADAR